MHARQTFHFPPDRMIERARGFHGLREVEHLRVASLFPSDIDAIAELILAKVMLGPAERIPLHVHPGHAEGIFVIRGEVVAQRERAEAQIRTHGAAYFPPGVPHSVTALQTDAEFLMFYPRANIGRDVASELLRPDTDQSHWPNPNVVKSTNPLWRWAVAEESEPWIPTEPTKGLDLRVRVLFDPPRGSPDLEIGTGMQEPNRHYTIHRHAPAEFYYILGGRGTYYVGDEAYEVEEGSVLYVPPMMPHGADSHDSYVNDFYVYGLDGSGDDYVWEALEAIYNLPRQQ
jgi:quercetin dioxygenase-like cupin family protein